MRGHDEITLDAPASLDRLRTRLAGRDRRVLSNPRSIACAVLVPLIAGSDGYGVVYTLRSEHLPNHKGQVSFAGGKHQASEDATLLATALREVEEEIGVSSAGIDVLGALDDVYTMGTDFVITPFVALLPENTCFRANASEVAHVFTVSLRDLDDRRHHEKEIKTWRGQEFEVDVIVAGSYRIWGATHRITIELLDYVSDSLR